MTFGDIKKMSLAKLDISNNDGEMGSSFSTDIISRFNYYAAEALEQISSAVKPKRAFFEIDNTNGNASVKVPDDFISFGDDVNFIEYDIVDSVGNTVHCRREATNVDFEYNGLSSLILHSKGVYTMSYNALWLDFLTVDDDTELECPRDILMIIPSFIAAECWKIDDQYRASVYRNEFEIGLARLNDNNFKRVSGFSIGGDW